MAEEIAKWLAGSLARGGEVVFRLRPARGWQSRTPLVDGDRLESTERTESGRAVSGPALQFWTNGPWEHL